MVEQCRRLARTIPLGMLLGGLLSSAAAAEPDAEVLNQLRRLAEQNEALERQLRRQQEVIDELSRRMGVLQSSADALGRATAQGEGDAPKRTEGFVAGRVRISGEGAIGLFHSQSDGMSSPSPSRSGKASSELWCSPARSERRRRASSRN